MQKICIVIPCYNEQNRLPVTSFIDSYNSSSYSFLFVNDGSKDLTINVLNELQVGREDRIHILDCKKNGGKAEAVRLGMLEAAHNIEFDIIGYLDADLATPLSEIPNITNNISENVIFAFGSRVSRIGAQINRKWSRHLLGRIFATIASKILKVKVYDTQCGAKFFSRNIVSLLYKDQFKTTWIFDIEVFLRIMKLKPDIDINTFAKEVPLHTWVDVDGSKLNLKQMLKIPLELLKLRNYFK